MSKISDEELKRLKEDTDLVALVRSSGVELKKQGANWMGHCPFHNDRTPSLIVTPNKYLWNCLGVCNAGGSAIDWIMKSKGVSFRHAVELLREGQTSAHSKNDKPIKKNTIPQLESPLDINADDQALLRQVINYYHENLKKSPEALKYLEKRGIVNADIITTFKLGYANRTLGLRLPNKNRVEGAKIRGRLTQLGIYRKSGHEHFSGSIVIPIIQNNQIKQVYGRKIRDNLREGTAYHLYLPHPLQGFFNPSCLFVKEIILCESLIDALSFWTHGLRNVTSSYGINGFTGGHFKAFQEHGIEKVFIAYDADEAGDQATQEVASQLMEQGITCHRAKFPRAMDANTFMLQYSTATEKEAALRHLIQNAEWLGGKGVRCTDPQIDEKFKAIQNRGQPLPSGSSLGDACPPSSNLNTHIDNEIVTITLGERVWKVFGLFKNLSFGSMRVNLRVSIQERLYLDSLDFYQTRQRNAFIQHAATELALKPEMIKRDLSKIFLKLEALQTEEINKTLDPKEIEVVLSKEEGQEAIGYLKDPDLIKNILRDFESCGLIGEETNKLAGYLSETSRKFIKPLAVMIQSASGAGKSALMDAILAFMPEEEQIKYSAMTGQSLFYMGETNLKHKILGIVEEEGAEKASYPLKLLSSEGSLTIASTGKEAQSGRLVTHEYHVEGPSMVFLTSTAIDPDEEFLNRCIVLTVNETREQTQAIHQIQRQAYSLESIFMKDESEQIKKLHQNIQRVLKPIKIINPYFNDLTFLDTQTRTRRDHMKYLTLIACVTFLHQYQRPLKQEVQGDKTADYIEVTLDDIELANELAHEVLGRSLDELPPQTRKLLNLIHQLVEEVAKDKDLDHNEVQLTRKQIRHYTGWGNTQLRVHLSRLVEMEYLLPRQGQRGQQFVYELLYDGEGQEGKRFYLQLIDVNKLS